MAEVAVHLDLASMPNDFTMLEIDIPDHASITSVPMSKLPIGWDQIPPIPSTKTLGDAFFHANEFLLLRVPSAVVFGDFNILINPHHPEFGHCRVTGSSSFPFDRRFFSR